MNYPIITVENLGKKYRLREAERQRYTALRDVIADKARRLFRPPPYSDRSTEEFWALEDIAFEIKEGEVVGIVGRNGAGKSTLLKILSRITEPTIGRARMKGRVASLLEVGTGFHPELTGRENIYLNGVILGMKRFEIRQKLDDIVAFAEVERFLDTPVKRYSSGMYVRLAFAVAAHLDPDILVIDEVLAVGDAAFQKKCLSTMRDASRKQGRTILFVSHNMQVIGQLCKRALLLESGRLVLDAESSTVVQRYLQVDPGETGWGRVAQVIASLPRDAAFRLHGVDVRQGGLSTTSVVSGQPIHIVVEYEVFEETAGLHVWFSFFDLDGTLLFESLHNGDSIDIPTVFPGRYISCAILPAEFLSGRRYEICINAGIHHVRYCIPQPSQVKFLLDVTALGRVNRGYPGYVTRGRIAPLFSWRTEPVGSPPDGPLTSADMTVLPCTTRTSSARDQNGL